MKTRNVRWLRISGFCGVLTPVVAFTCISLSIASAPEFSWVDNALSDLGVMHGFTAAVFNYGLIVSGILCSIFATNLVRLLRFDVFSHDARLLYPDNRGLGGVLIFSLACLALVAIGVFPENVKYLHFFCFRSVFCAVDWCFVAYGHRFLACETEANCDVHVAVKRGCCYALAAAVFGSLRFGGSYS